MTTNIVCVCVCVPFPSSFSPTPPIPDANSSATTSLFSGGISLAVLYNSISMGSSNNISMAFYSSMIFQPILAVVWKPH